MAVLHRLLTLTRAALAPLAGAGVLMVAVTHTQTHAQVLPAPPVSPAPVVNYEYDAQGNPTKTVQAPGVIGFGFTTSATYDKLNRAKDSTDPKAGKTQFGYNGREDLTQVTDPRNLITQTPRNGLGDATQLVSPDTGTATHTYDAAGNLQTRTDSRGVTSSYSYDALNRLTSVNHVTPGYATRNYSFNYDEANTTHGVGRLTSAISFDATFVPNPSPGSWVTAVLGSSAYSYDAWGRVVIAAQATGATAGTNSGTLSHSVTYGYDSAGRVNTVVYPSGRVLLTSYTGGLPSALSLAKDGASAPQTLLSQIQWQPFGGPRSWQWQMASGPQSHDRVYDIAGRVVRYRLGNTIRDLTYDAADRIIGYTHYDAGTAAATPALNQGFVYDELGRLTGITTASASWSIGYDANGNRTSVTLNASTSAYTTAGTSNRLASITNPARAFSYDAAGNTTADGQFTGGTYDPDGRLRTLTKAGVTSTYTYNGFGQRVRKFSSTGAASTVVFVYDQQGQLLGEYDVNGTALREYAWLGNTPVAVFTPDAANAANPPLVYYIHTDHLDTPRVVVDKNNALRWRWLAEPFGTTAPETNPSSLGAFTQNLRFPGQYADSESGLNYNYFRDYDAPTGRYVQSDPIGLQGGINTYAYSFNQPTRYTDPKGLDPFDGARPSPSPGVPGPFDVFIPGSPANQRFVDTTWRFIKKIGDMCTASDSDREKECKEQLDREEKLCVAIAGSRYGGDKAKAIRVCQTAAFNRYAACLKGTPPAERPPLTGVDTPI